MSDELLKLADAQVPSAWHRDVLSMRERLIRDLAARVRELEAEVERLRAGEREWYDKLQAADAENERLRWLLQEAADTMRRWAPNSIDLIGRIDAALAGEKL